MHHLPSLCFKSAQAADRLWGNALAHGEGQHAVHKVAEVGQQLGVVSRGKVAPLKICVALLWAVAQQVVAPHLRDGLDEGMRGRVSFDS